MKQSSVQDVNGQLSSKMDLSTKINVIIFSKGVKMVDLTIALYARGRVHNVLPPPQSRQNQKHDSE